MVEQKQIMLDHYTALLTQFGNNAGVRLARKHLSWYSRGLPGSAEFRATMNRLPDAAAVLRLIDMFYDPLIARIAGGAPIRRITTLADTQAESPAALESEAA